MSLICGCASYPIKLNIYFDSFPESCLGHDVIKTFFPRHLTAINRLLCKQGVLLFSCYSLIYLHILYLFMFGVNIILDSVDSKVTCFCMLSKKKKKKKKKSNFTLNCRILQLFKSFCF